MIARLWRGWTRPEDADEYERLLREVIFPGIAARRIPGYLGIHLLRRTLDEEVEFSTVMWFDSLEAVREFAGDDYEAAYVPPAARKILSRFDAGSTHHEVRAATFDPPFPGEPGA